MPAPLTPTQIRYETERFFVRPLFATDASAHVCAWFADPHTARMLNVPAQPLTLDDLHKYVAAHDGINVHILGMFDKTSRALLGIWAVYVDWEQREFQLNIVVGERGPNVKGVRFETQRPLVRILYDDLDLLVGRASVLARNKTIERRFEVNHVAHEHTSFKPSAYEAAPEEVHHYSITRDQWRQILAAQLEQERLEKERLKVS